MLVDYLEVILHVSFFIYPMALTKGRNSAHSLLKHRVVGAEYYSDHMGSSKSAAREDEHVFFVKQHGQEVDVI